MAGFFKSIKEEWRRNTDPEQLSKSLSVKKLFSAVCRHDYKSLQTLIEEQYCDINQYSVSGETPFHIAVKTGSIEMVKQIIKLGGDPHLPVKGITAYDSAVHLAIEADQPQMIPVLRQLGFSLSAAARNGWSPLRHAIELDRPRMIEALLREGAEAGSLKKGGEDAFFRDALVKINADTLKTLIKFPQLWENGDAGRVAFETLRRTQPEAAKLLLESGVSVNCTNDKGQSPLYLAIQDQDAELLEYLVKNGADLNKRFDDRGLTPFQFLCQIAHQLDTEFVAQAFSIMVDYGADLTSHTREGRPVVGLIKNSRSPVLKNLWQDRKR